MFQRFQSVCVALFGMFVLCATPALANVDAANATITCNAYSLSVSASQLIPGNNYEIDYEIDSSPYASGFPITGTIPFTATSSTFNSTVTGSFPALNGNFSFSGTASMPGYKGDLQTVSIDLSPSNLSCGTPLPLPCSTQSTIGSNFNGTQINAGSWIWFNANFSAKGIPSTGATITFTDSAISTTGRGTPFSSSAPNAQITFSPSATCSSTTFNAMTNTWMTTVPVNGDDEIFLSGITVPVPSTGFPDGKVEWTGVFSSNGVSGISIQWKWSAAVYSTFTSDYNALAVKPGHQTACGMSNGDHAGTPEGVNNNNRPWKQFVIGGARGGGGSNWTGSWSGTQSVSLTCASTSQMSRAAGQLVHP
jgi:hypothetical protein